MPELIIAAAVVTAVALGFVAAWSRRRLALRVVAAGLSVSFLVLLAGAMSELLGRPKPVRLEWNARGVADADVLAGRIVEGKGIYLWLTLPGLDEPRTYVMPWDMKLARQLKKSLDESARDGGRARLRLPFEPSLEEREQKFYVSPQPRAPDKPYAAPRASHDERW